MTALSDRDYGDVAMSEAGARSMTRTRDGASSTVFEVRFTAVADYLTDLKSDFAAGLVTDNLLRLAIVQAPATVEQITGAWNPGATRHVPTYRSKYLTSSYQARGQLHHLSVYCGVAWVAREKPPARALELTRSCAEALQQATRQLQSGVVRLGGLDVRGGAVYVQDPESDQWLAAYLSSIETPPEPVCKHCGEAIYYSNEKWRHKSTGRDLVTVPFTTRDGRVIQHEDHYAEMSDEVAA